MCGIVGFVSGATRKADILNNIVDSMADTLRHRGPDDSGTWADQDCGIALGHRRLSIVDLSPAGHQPMLSSNGNLVIVFNGEIYNHGEIRNELETSGTKQTWIGHSDTETLLAAFGQWGVETTLNKAVGMFAFALWNRQEKCLTLARDRFGEKPLYYGWVGDAFVFGSELKALKAYPGFDNPVCRDALAEYLSVTHVPAPRSIYAGIFKLEPGCMLRVNGSPPFAAPFQPLRAPAKFGSLILDRWWSLAQVVEVGARNPISNERQGIDELETRLREAVRIQSLADVPLGAFLSGGVDSSTIVTLMQQVAARPVKTFTVGFEDADFDESPHAKKIAKHLGTDHTELFVTASEARAIIPQLSEMYDEPFADSSQIPTHIVCRAARSHVTVALSGDAGDELFGGYNRYFWGPIIWNRISWLPATIRQGLSSVLCSVSPSTLNLLFKQSRHTGPGEKLHKIGAALHGANSIDKFYLNILCEGTLPFERGGKSLLSETSIGTTGIDTLAVLPNAGMDDARLRMMYWDTVGYLPDDILTKVDRAAMSCGLETRMPFLDHRVAELAWQLPINMKIRGTEGKWALRQVLYKYVPRKLIEREKSGFAVPIGQWLRGPLREWAASLLEEGRLRREGYLNPDPIVKAWQQHLSGRYVWTTKLWTVLMFQAWLEANS